MHSAEKVALEAVTHTHQTVLALVYIDIDIDVSEDINEFK
jgi:hypothetical protein